MNRGVALGLALLVLVPLFPIVAAEPPTPEPWAPYATGATINAVALARDGSVVAAALAEVPTTGTCTPQPPLPTCVPSTAPTAPNTKQPDLSIINVASGIVRNGTGNLAVSGQTAHPLGRTLVAVTSDGHAVASVGIDTSSSGIDATSTSSARSLKLYLDVAAGANFSSISTVSAYLPGARAAGLVLSDDASRIAILVDDDAGNLTLLGYNAAPPALTQAFSFGWSGTARALAADGPLGRIYVAGDLFQRADNATLASVALVPYAVGTQTNLYSEPGNGTSATSLAATPDGSIVVLGTANGRMVTLDGATLGLGTAYQAGPTTVPVGPVAIAHDGSHLAAAGNGALAAFTLRGLTPILSWNTTLDGVVNSLSYNATGAILAAGVNGTAGGAYAFGDDGSTPFWSVPGDVRGVAIDDRGLEIAYAQGKVVQAQHLLRTFALEHPSGQKTGPVRPLRAGASAVFDMVVRNPGSAPESVAFSASADPFLATTVSPSLVTVRPGESRHVNVTLASTPRFTGVHSVNLTAMGLSTVLSDSATLSVSFEGVANVTFQVNQTEFLVAPGLPTEALLTIANNGTTAADVTLRHAQVVSVGLPWDLVVDQPSFVVPQGSITTVKVRITAPPTTVNGTSDTITFNLEGPSVSDQVVLNFRVNPHLMVDITSPRRVQFVEPSHSAYFNVTVTNTGSLSREFIVFGDASPTNGRFWAVVMNTAAFRLDAGANRTIPIEVKAPSDATPVDKVSVLVRARSISGAANESIVEANVTLFANAIAPTLTTTTPTASNPIPFPTLLAVAACLALAVAVRRRRNA